MATFSKCLEIVNAMPQRDQDALLARLDELQAQGMSPKEAQLRAAIDVLAQVEREGQVLKSVDRTYRDANILGDLGSLSNDPDYAAGKSGDLEAAIRTARRVVTPGAIDAVSGIEDPIIVGVVSVEASGRNKVPFAAASVLANKAGAELDTDIVQASSPKRTAMEGLGRIFSRPLFDGPVQAGRNYVLVDDTITQGGTFAALSDHIEDGGGKVAAVIALSGKQYSAKISADPATISSVRQKFGDLENDFQKATGYNLDQLTQSEARYLANFKPASAVRDRILAEAGKAGRSEGKENSGVLKSVDRPQFYSQLQRAIESVPDRLATMAAPAWKQWLTANAPKLGVKADEIEWSGIKDYLDLQGKAKLSKDDLARYLDDSGVKVGEVTLGDTAEPGFEEQDDGTFNAYIGDRLVGNFPTEDEALYAAEGEQVQPTKYGKYTLPGGENYREVLITLPSNDEVAKREQYSVFDESGELIAQGMWPPSARSQANLDAHPEWRIEREAVPDQNDARRKGVYQSSHWDEPNVLAHIRVNDRTDADGKRVLFVEEVQSDWGQDGKKKGFKQEVDRAAIEGRMQEITARLREIAKSEVDDSPELQAEWNSLSDEKSHLTNELVSSNSGVPVAPFVTKTEGWLNLALKRIAMLAVEGGYDKVAFVNGEQPADRYDLSKHVDFIGYSPEKGLLQTFDTNRHPVFTKDNVKPEDLDDYIGKELAKKVLDSDPVMGTHILEGADLKVGGEGMKTFYDKLVPQALNKLLPKLGGEKLGDVSVRAETPRSMAKRRAIESKPGEWRIESTLNGRKTWLDGRYPSQEEANAEIARMDKPKTMQQPGFDVTDRMRETVGQGVPLFSRDRKIDTPEFKKWFGDSKVVDADGKPLVMYHGPSSTEPFTEFSAYSMGWFAPTRGTADTYANSPTIEAYLSIQNPLDVTEEYSSDVDQLRWDVRDRKSEWEAKGYDGVKVYDPRYGEYHWIPFRPDQIKSATGNSGQFDSTNPDIRKSADRPWFDDLAKLKVGTNYQLGDLFKSSKKLSWWDKTVGTMYNVAEKHPQFKRVFDAVQTFINDVSAYATRAADLAPTILPKLETLRDIAKSPLSAADVKALSQPVFGGTLRYTRDENGEIVETDDVQKAGVVFTDSELRKMFGLSDRQIGLYREFRAAVDASLTDLAVSDMLRYVGEDGVDIREAVMAAGNVDVAAGIIESHLEHLIADEPKRAYVLGNTIAEIKDKAEQANRLMDRGYAPLTRFGQYTVYVTKDNGKDQVFFGMYESQAEANKAARDMRDQYPDATVETGTMSQESYKLFSGVTPETLALFGESLGLEENGVDQKSEVFQQYLKLAKNNRSAMKRMMERKGVEGFSEDAGRVLAGFVMSNARQISTNLHAGEIGRSVMAIDQRDGDIRDAAVKLMEYVQDPRENAQAIKALLFTTMIGGSVASALVNATQTVTMTLPYLSQFVGGAKATKAMGEAYKMAARGVRNDSDLAAALKRAEDEGIVSPQEVHQLMAQARGQGSLKSGDGTKVGDASAKLNNAMAKIMVAWGKLFSAAEMFNRRVTFIAAYKLARDNNLGDPVEFARKAIVESQGLLNKGNRPTWARGTVGGTLFVFRQYAIHYLEFLHRMWGNGPEGKKAVGLALGMLFLTAGLGGMPGADDLDDVIDGFARRILGKSLDSKQAKKEFFASILGQSGAEFVMSGVSGIPGVPIDVSGRLGLGNLIPATGALKPKKDYNRDFMEVFGAAGSLISNYAAAASSIANGDVGKAAEVASPLAVQNLIKALDMAQSGQYRDFKGRKVIDVDGWEAMAKAVGFQPSSVKKVQEATSTQQELIALNRFTESQIVDKMVKARTDRKPELMEEARREMQEWNAANPSSPIKIDASQVNRRVQEANKTKAQRLAAAAPKEIRESVKKQLEPADQ